ncbi:hypothetical protein [Actinoallomurus sp. NPDC050550]|uniref:hypothetical protein n=1 Tax=Actinoallomurus sp. NPDC050550 TaxID=3154937 RepID=UPI0033EDB62D
MKRAKLVPVAVAAGFAAMTLAAPAADAATEAKGSVSVQSVKLTAQRPSRLVKKKVVWLHASAYYELSKGKTSITRVCVQVSSYKSTRNCGSVPHPVSGGIGSKDIKCGKKGIWHGVKSVAWFENKNHEQIGDKRQSGLYMIKC